MDDVEVKIQFRFIRADIYRLKQLLQIPDEIRIESRYVVQGLTALCILLRRLAYPNRLDDLKRLFGRSCSALSRIIQYTVIFICGNWPHLLDNLHNLQWLNQNRFRIYAEVVRNRGGAIPNCWSFIDETARPICRPYIDQQIY